MKAFDSIDHDFLFATITKYGLGSNFIQWIETLVSNCKSCVVNNVWSEWRDPLSPHLFIYVSDILFIQVRNDPSVKGRKRSEGGATPIEAEFYVTCMA